MSGLRPTATSSRSPPDHAAVVELDAGRTVLVARDPHGARAGANVDPALGQGRGDLLAGERLLAREQSVERLDHGHAGSERAPRLGHLDADDASAEHDEMTGRVAGRRDLAIGPRLRLGEPRDRRHRGARADGDDHRLARLEHVVADAHPPLAVQPRRAAHERDALGRKPRDLV